MTSALAYDLIVIGGGAAGLMCASVAGQRGLRVLLLDHSERRAEKIRISGGGRCNFTNLEGDRLERFTGADPRFARFALRAYPPGRFIDLVRAHRIGYHEKHKGQLFCDESAEQIIDMLSAE
ncbi:MAG: NAD(P)/FAD-dependent oxidoreductase, partial [Betaproteobacteria bacterium]|nr:NAD(P)/FAD-dependent oxidoreductase [Betaproteobacteria bacterium]